METREFIMIISAMIIVIDWFINSYLNRKHEIFKKRLDYRLSMLESYKEAAETLERLFKHNKQELADDFILLEKYKLTFYYMVLQKKYN